MSSISATGGLDVVLMGLSTETISTGVAGDYNGNGVVDMADYVLWRNGGPLQNEINSIGTVDASDYTAWRSRFGDTSGAGSGLSASQVPEPRWLSLAMLGCHGNRALHGDHVSHQSCTSRWRNERQSVLKLTAAFFVGSRSSQIRTESMRRHFLILLASLACVACAPIRAHRQLGTAGEKYQRSFRVFRRRSSQPRLRNHRLRRRPRRQNRLQAGLRKSHFRMQYCGRREGDRRHRRMARPRPDPPEVRCEPPPRRGSNRPLQHRPRRLSSRRPNALRRQRADELFTPALRFEQHDIAITGSRHLRRPSLEKSLVGLEIIRHSRRQALRRMGDDDMPLEQRTFGEDHQLRPNFVQFYHCNNVLIEGITFTNSPMWFLHPVLCTNVTIRSVTLAQPRTEQRRLRSRIVPRRAHREVHLRHRRRLHRHQIRPRRRRPPARMLPAKTLSFAIAK